ncbi:MAG TPA: HAD family hydrolase [Candidatus Udaeobacter sp.]|jgi:putative hydrolase of the HAD superfamily|nr:HAD family hydrolase [Candidatus Udaeobacter sp.]
MPEERPILEAVLFDAGGTLVRIDFEWVSERLSAHGVRVAWQALRAAEINGRQSYDESLNGRRGEEPAPSDASQPLGSAGDNQRYYIGMLASAKVPVNVIEKVVAEMQERHRERGLWSRPAEGARKAIDDVAALGLRMAVVSNSDGRAEQHLIESGVRDGIEFVVDSQHVGIEKPDPRILGIALERMKVDASRALYVGDIRSVDEEAAAAAGMHFVLLDPYANYGQDIETLPTIGDLADYIRMTYTPQSATWG